MRVPYAGFSEFRSYFGSGVLNRQEFLKSSGCQSALNGNRHLPPPAQNRNKICGTARFMSLQKQASVVRRTSQITWLVWSDASEPQPTAGGHVMAPEFPPSVV